MALPTHPTPAPSTLHGLFVETVLQTPGTLAIDNHETCLTYAHLDAASTALAEDLIRQYGVQPRALVLLLTSHGPRNVVAILGILKAGACYIPIDRARASDPAIQGVLGTVDDAVLLVNTTPDAFDAHPNANLPMLHMTKIPQEPLSPTTTVPLPACSPQDAACIIFTSGSTGTPKGVVIPHEAIAYYAKCQPYNMDVRPGDRVLHILNVAFDACTCVLFSTILNSGTLVPASTDTMLEATSGCTILAATPSILETLSPPTAPDQLYPKVHTVLLGGETPPPPLLRAWLDAGIRMLNGYGPTEAASGGAIHDIKDATMNAVVGTPMPESPVYLLDADLNILHDDDDDDDDDDDVEGEIAISGRSLATGYYKDEARTQASFIIRHGTRLYRTGDYGRWIRQPVGPTSPGPTSPSLETPRLLEFRGRKDRKVKNRGFLVNLGADIETPILALPGFGVKQAHATKHKNRLVVVCTPATVDGCALQQVLRAQLSPYRVPDRVVVVDRLPLSPNGKVIPSHILEILETMMVDEQPARLSGQPSTRTGRCKTDTVAGLMAAALDRTIDSPDANFFELGGQSLEALKLVSLGRHAGLAITVHDVYRLQTVGQIAHEAQELSQCPDDDDDDDDRLPPVHTAPLTRLQLELILPTVDADGTNTNQMTLTYGGRDASPMVAAWKTIHAVEPVFRTEIRLDVDQGVQAVGTQTAPPGFEIFTNRPMYETAVRSVPMQVGLGSRLDIYHYVPASRQPHDDEEATVVLTVHHALMDGYSAGLLRRKVARLAVEGHDAVPSPSPSFLEACRQLTAIQDARDIEARRFWDEYLQDATADDDDDDDDGDGMPVQTPAVAAQHDLAFSLPVAPELLQRFAATQRLSLATVHYTAWALALSELLAQPDVVVGAVFAGREALPAYAEAIGPLLATLPLRIRLPDDDDTSATMPVATLLRQAMAGLATCSQYAWSRPDQMRLRPRNLLAMQCGLVADEDRMAAGMTVRERSSFGLSLLVHGRGECVLSSTVHGDADLARIRDVFAMALRALLECDTVSACRAMLSSPASVSVSASGSPSTSTSPAGSGSGRGSSVSSAPDDLVGATVTAAFEAAASRHAQRLAVEHRASNTALTYAVLDRLATAVAQQLRRTVPGAAVVAIYADGSPNWITGILGILKAGAAYCPLDPAWPAERRQAVSELSEAEALLVPQSVHRDCVQGTTPIPVLVVGDITHGGAEDEALSRGPPSPTLFIVFTSGTTGKPKGVPVSHRGFLALQSNPVARFFVQPGHRIAQFMSPAFDCCANEVFSALLHGAALVLRDAEHPYAHLKTVDIANLTPSVLGVLDESEYANLSILYSSGEAVTPGLVSRFGAGRQFYNGYGPAECSVFASFARLVPGSPVTIGNGTETVRLYVLDDDLQPVAAGANGEIFVAGEQVMHGYIGAPQETARRLLADPWHPGQSMFRTGDYGRRCSRSGAVEYIGRVDRMVKLRGSRIELPAVEQHLYDCDARIALAAAAVLNDCLVAFVTPADVDTEAVRARLARCVVPAWVPQVMVAVDELPRTVNKKIDYQQLGALLAVVSRTRTGAEPGVSRVPIHGPFEEQVAVIWRVLLHLEPDVEIFADDHFFRRGGHSVLQLLLASQLSKAFGICLSTRDMVRHPVLRAQAALVQQQQQQASSTAAPEQALTDHAREPVPNDVVTDLERQVWALYQVATSSTSAFNIPVALKITGAVDTARLQTAINAVFASQPVLRSNFIGHSQGSLRRQLRPWTPTVQLVDDLDLVREINRPFDLAHDELMRAYLCRADHRRLLLLLVSTHALTDRHGVQTLLRAISQVYSAQHQPVSISIPPTLDHLQSPVWQHRQPSAEDTQFWRTTLADLPPALNLHRRTSQALFEGSSHWARHAPAPEDDGGVIARLGQRARQLGVTKHQVVLATVALALGWLTGAQDVVLGAPWDNRPSALESSSAAQFLERLPIRICTAGAGGDSDSDSGDDLLLRAREASQRAVAHAIPFSQILDVLGLGLQHPVFECAVTFHLLDGLKDCLVLPDCAVTEHALAAKGAKFLIVFEWMEVASDEWTLRMEYDHSRLARATIEALDGAIGLVLAGLAHGCSRADIHARLDEFFAPSSSRMEDNYATSLRALGMGACMET